MLPLFCRCGNPVRFSNDNRCEDCWTNDQAKYKVGVPTRVKTNAMSAREELEAEVHTERLRKLFQAGEHEVQMETAV